MPFMLRDSNAPATKVSRKILGVPSSQQYCEDKKRVLELEKAFNNSKRTTTVLKELEYGKTQI
jgi:hypothetical protein